MKCFIRLLVLVSAGLMAAALAACQADPPPNAPAIFVQPAAAPPMAPMDQVPLPRADVYQPDGASGVYDVTHDSKPQRQIPFKVQAEGDADWLLDLQSVRALHMTEEGDGSLVVARQDEIGDNVTMTYWPPLKMLPATLTPNQPQAFDCQVVVRNRKDGSARDEGDCHATVELLGRQHVHTPAGDFNAYMVRTTRQLNLNFVSIHIDILDAYVADRGPVKEQIQEERRILGLLVSKQSEAWELER